MTITANKAPRTLDELTKPELQLIGGCYKSEISGARASLSIEDDCVQIFYSIDQKDDSFQERERSQYILERFFSNLDKNPVVALCSSRHADHRTYTLVNWKKVRVVTYCGERFF